jgi:hypothetical protein
MRDNNAGIIEKEVAKFPNGSAVGKEGFDWHGEKPDLPKYRCHKVVRAIKITNVAKHAHPDPAADDGVFEASAKFQGASLITQTTYGRRIVIPVDADWYRVHKPSSGGYFVEYEDGYTSFSPAKPFESGYSAIEASTVMREITTHKVNGCNEAITISVLDHPGHGGACHKYLASCSKGTFLPDAAIPDSNESGNYVRCEIDFQNGPVAEVGTNGITHEVLLAILIDRLQGFQKGQYACRENALALTKLEEGLFWAIIYLAHQTNLASIP